MRHPWLSVIVAVALGVGAEARAETIRLASGVAQSDIHGAYLFVYDADAGVLQVSGQSFQRDGVEYQNNLAGTAGTGRIGTLATFADGTFVDAYLTTVTTSGNEENLHDTAFAEVYFARTESTDTQLDALVAGEISLAGLAPGGRLAIAGHFFASGMTQIDPPSLLSDPGAPPSILEPIGESVVVVPMFAAYVSLEGDLLRLDLDYDFTSTAEAHSGYANNPAGTRILIRPVPEPGAIGVSIVTVIGLAARRRRAA